MKIPGGDEDNSRGQAGAANVSERRSAAPGTGAKIIPTLKGSHHEVAVRPFQGRILFLTHTGGGAPSRSLCPRLLSLSLSGIRACFTLVERRRASVPGSGFRRRCIGATRERR